ncbi:MAG: acetoacetate decarboxylase family protein [Elusimicrobia bacterium]|nr:acetoacetate decarboxylase family protein [Elusimicrobiota bacterium]
MSALTFFDGYKQEPVSIRGAPGKSPMFFRDFNMMGATFLADLPRARAALPNGWYRPLSMPLRRALIGVHCMEYKDSDIGPYNEISLSIALKRGWLPFMSLLQAARSLQSQTYHAYIKALPVTTETALHGGIDFFNYPKYLADISFRETAAHRVCTLRDKDSHDVILEFEGRRIATWSCAPKDENRLTLYTYPDIGGRPRRAKLLVNRLESGTARLRGARLRLGSHPRAREFSALRPGPVVEYLYAPRCQGVLFKPEPF